MRISRAFFLLFVVVISELAAGDDIPAWEEFKAKYDKHYGGTRKSEESRRHHIFNENVAKIRAHNKLYEEGKSSYKLGVNAFCDKTDQEIIRSNTGLIPPPDTAPESVMSVHQEKADYPDVDWTNNNCMTPVRNQGQCGSCWAFAANTALNTRYCMVKNLQSVGEYSDQHLVDCDVYDGGCNGGWPYNAYYFIWKNDTSMRSDYPYAAKDQTCKTGVDSSKIISPGSNVVYRPKANYACKKDGLEGDESCILSALQDGPVAVAINVNNNFHYYSGGVLDDGWSGAFHHAVTVTGAGETTSDGKFWIVQNSWGTGWGENGYIRMRRGLSNNGCLGINSYVMWPEVR